MTMFNQLDPAKPLVILAPMAGYTDSALRGICKRYGCGMVFTEVVNAEAIVHGSKITMHMLETEPGENPIAAHIYGSKPEIMAEAVSIIEKLDRFDFIDLNCGCPVRKIVAKGSGAALMADPQKIHDIIKAMCQATSLPVTAKTRLGLTPERNNISEVAQAMEEAGASAIHIHARFASSRHNGPADWGELSRIKSERNIPIIGNGGVDCAADAPKMLEQTGVNGVMIARAAVGNPWIFDEIEHIFAGKPYTPHSLEEHRQIISEHLDRLVALKSMEKKYRRKKSMPPDQAAALHFRSHLVQYLSGFKGWRQILHGLQTMHTIEGIMAAVDQVLALQTSVMQ